MSELLLPRRMPKQKPGRSKQDYGTPKVFLDAVRRRLGIVDFDIDLAASPENAVCPRFYTQADNALVQPWRVDSGWAWLNPPFAHLRPWVERAYLQARTGPWEARAKVAMLVPAGVGSAWWAAWVHGKCAVLLLTGRLTFVGETMPYPKDCCLLLYGPYTPRLAYDVWDWRAA